MNNEAMFRMMNVPIIPYDFVIFDYQCCLC